jgi:polyferredoxin
MCQFFNLRELMQTGTIVSLVTAPLIIRSLGWPAVFFLFGSVGFFWLLLWQPLAFDKARQGLPSAALLSREESAIESRKQVSGNSAARHVALSDAAHVHAKNSESMNVTRTVRRPMPHRQVNLPWCPC